MASNCVIFSTWWLHDISEILRSTNLRSMVCDVESVPVKEGGKRLSSGHKITPNCGNKVV